MEDNSVGAIADGVAGRDVADLRDTGDPNMGKVQRYAPR